MELEPWAAFDVEQYTSGRLTCGQQVILLFTNGQVLTVRAWDAGRFRDRWVNSFGPDMPIVVDLPEHLKPDRRGSWTVIAIWGIGDMIEPLSVPECHQWAMDSK